MIKSFIKSQNCFTNVCARNVSFIPLIFVQSICNAYMARIIISQTADKINIDLYHKYMYINNHIYTSYMYMYICKLTYIISKQWTVIHVQLYQHFCSIVVKQIFFQPKFIQNPFLFSSKHRQLTRGS